MADVGREFTDEELNSGLQPFGATREPHAWGDLGSDTCVLDLTPGAPPSRPATADELALMRAIQQRNLLERQENEQRYRERPGIDKEIESEEHDIALEKHLRSGPMPGDPLMPANFYETQKGFVDIAHAEKLEDLKETKALAGCSPTMLVIILVVLAGALGVGIVATRGGDSKKTSAGTSQPSAAVTPTPGATVYTGSSGGSVGCVPCDGKARFIAIQSPPGPGSFPGVEGKSQAAIQLGPGTLQNLRVEVNGTDRGRWSASLDGASLGCVLQPGATSCVAEGPYELTAATLVSLIVGNDGDPKIYGNPNGQLNPNGSPVPLVHPESDGAFTMTFTFEFIPV